MKQIYLGPTNTPAHRAAVQAKRLERLLARYGAADARAAWERTLATYRQSGRTESEIIRACMGDHPELAAAYNTCRPLARPQVQRPALSATDQRWEGAIAERQKRGLSRVEAILDIRKTDPDLYAARR